MQIDRTIAFESASNVSTSRASLAQTATLASRLGRKSSSKWAKIRSEGVVALTATGLTCILSAILVETALAQSVGIIAA